MKTSDVKDIALLAAGLGAAYLVYRTVKGVSNAVEYVGSTPARIWNSQTPTGIESIDRFLVTPIGSENHPLYTALEDSRGTPLGVWLYDLIHGEPEFKG